MLPNLNLYNYHNQIFNSNKQPSIVMMKLNYPSINIQLVLDSQMNFLHPVQ